MSKILHLLKLLASDKITIVVLILLMLLTIFGTIDQKNIGLYQAKKKYFESIVYFWTLGNIGETTIKLPFPGAYGVLIVFFVNLLASLILKFPWKWKSVGSLVCHIGFLFLLLGSFWGFHSSQEGYISFSPGQSFSEFVHYHNYQLVVAMDDNSPDLERMIVFPQQFLVQGKVLKKDTLPFTMLIKEYYPNCRIIEREGQLVELKPIELAKENQLNWPGCKIQIMDSHSVVGETMIAPLFPAQISYQNKVYRMELTKQKMELPFSIQLLSARQEFYPGTSTPKHFESKITVTEGKSATNQEFTIQMNRPFRYKGYTFYQSGFNEVRGQITSTLSVVKNPASILPYISCFLIGLGMLVHFFQKLFLFLLHKQK